VAEHYYPAIYSCGGGGSIVLTNYGACLFEVYHFVSLFVDVSI